MRKHAKIVWLSLFLVASGGSAIAADERPLSNAALIQKGEKIAVESDCQACHTQTGGSKRFAGGYKIILPMGVIYTTNITPDKQTGIGQYSEAQFARAVREGIRADGANLYPAMPYTSYVKLSDDDIHALYTYFMYGVAPVAQRNMQTKLPFPFNLRFILPAWNMLFLKEGHFISDNSKNAQWNRGAYLVNGPGHCDTCHTPRNLLLAEYSGQPLSGAMVGSWYAPNITSDPISGIGGWSQAQLIQYLKTGRVAGKNQAAGGMAEAIENSLQYLSDNDLTAIAIYLKNSPPTRDPHDKQPADSFGKPFNVETDLRGAHPPNANKTVKDGAALFSGNCASCHQPDGSGSQNQAYPSLFNNTATGSRNPSNLISAILFGVDRRVGDQHILMPNFGPQSYVNPLNDQEIAAISNYVLQHYGNPTVHVTAEDVAVLRQGGPVPLLEVMQPYMAPGLCGGVLVMLAAIAWLIVRKRRRI